MGTRVCPRASWTLSARHRRVRQRRPERGIIKEAAGRYFASFVIDTDGDVDAARFVDVDSEVGVDVGVKAFAVLSDGTVIDAPKFLRRAERKLRKAQQVLARKKKGSHNRRKQVVKVARVHARVADARRDFHQPENTDSRVNTTRLAPDEAMALTMVASHPCPLIQAQT